MAAARHSENIEVHDEEGGHYENLDLEKIEDAVYDDIQPKKENGPSAGRSPFRVVAGCLGMLCLILLGVNIGQALYLTLTLENNQLKSDYKNLTQQNSQLKTDYKNLTQQNSQLKTDYKNLTQQNSQLKTDYKNLTQQLTQLKDEVIQLKSQTTVATTTTVSDRKAVIKNAQMSEDMQRDAVEVATQALEKYNYVTHALNASKYMKEEFDKKYNPEWNCIVGRNFGSYVYHKANHYIFFFLGQVKILLFKSP